MTGNSKKLTRSSNREKILSIVTGGIVIALSFVLSSIKIFEMPMGGSVTPASILPIAVFAVAFGPAWGFAAAIVFSILQVISGLEWFVTPFQMLLDYVLGYASLGIIGFAALPAEKRLKYSNPIARFVNGGIVRAVIFTVIAYAVRWFCSVLSGVIFYAEYAGDMNPWVYSMVYNGSFLLADLGVLLAVMLILFFTLKATYKNKK